MLHEFTDEGRASAPRFLFALLFGVCAWSAIAGRSMLRGRVIGVTDGDTVNVVDGRHRLHRIRLEGIDAPELDQPFGADSKRHLRSVLLGKTVDVEVSTVDLYGREVGKVMLGDRDVCLEEVRGGWAWDYAHYASEQTPEDRVAYSEAEARARAAHDGLWAHAHPQPPWEFREQRAAKRARR